MLAFFPFQKILSIFTPNLKKWISAKIVLEYCICNIHCIMYINISLGETVLPLCVKNTAYVVWEMLQGKEH